MMPSLAHFGASMLDYVAGVLVGLLLLLLATLWLLRSKSPRTSVYVSLGKLLRLHVTVSVDRPDRAKRKEHDGENR